MTEVPLPPLPILPASNTERAAWVRWATEAVLQERERAARVCDRQASDYEDDFASDGDERWLVYAKHARRLAAAIRNG